jgi:MFS family permease
MNNTDKPEHPAAPGAYSVLRNRDFVRYLLGRLVAVLGQQMFTLAIGWEIYDRTGSALSLAAVGVTQMIPMFVFTLPAGHVADNYNRKRVIVLMTTVLGATSLILALISALQAPVLCIYFCLFVTGTARTFMWASSAAFLPGLVERRDFARAVNWNTGVFQLACIAGPSAAGALIALILPRHPHQAAAAVYALNALAALVFCLLVTGIRWHHTPGTREPMTVRTLLTGFQFVFASKIILGIITLDMFAVFLGGATSLLPIYAKDILHAGPDGLGLLVAAMPLGAVVCMMILNHRPPLQKAGRALLWAVAAFGLATIGFGLSTWFWLSFTLLCTCGAVDNISVVVRHTLVQLLTPDDKRGRVSAVNNLFIGTSNELGGSESSLVAHLFGPALGHTLVTGAVISAVSGGIGTIAVVIGVAILWPEIRKYGRLDAH